MKRIIIYSTVLVAIVAILNACRKDDNPRIPSLEKFEWMPLFVKDQTTDVSIDGKEPASFVGKFTIDKYFETDINPQKADIVVIKNGDNANIKMIKPDVTTFPTTVEITGPQLETLFGEPIILGDNFTIGVDITTPGGKKFEAFPAIGNSYAAGITAQPGASPTIDYLAACTFDKNSFNGPYEVIQDDWADFNPGETVNVTPGAGVNQISVLAYPSPAYGTNRKPMLVDVNPTTFAATITEQVIGDYTGAPPGATARGDGTVNPCGDELNLNVTFKIGGTDYEDYKLILRKK
jgi:hypothetical protein